MAAGKCTCADMSRHPDTLFHFRVGGFVARSDQTKDYIVGICCFATEQVILRSKNKDWLARNQDHVPGWGNMSIRGLLFQCDSTIIQLSVLV